MALLDKNLASGLGDIGKFINITSTKIHKGQKLKFKTMKFTSGKRVVRNISIEQLKLKIEKIAKPKIQIETLDQIDVYEINLRVRIKGKGEAFYTEIPTTITLKKNKIGFEIITHSKLFKPLLFSVGLALTTGLLYFSVCKNWNVLIPFSIVLIISYNVFIYKIKKRATELLMQIG